MPRFSKDDWAQLSPLIDEALGLPPEARTEWLRRHKITHPTIAGELEALLNRESALEAEGFLSADKAPELPPVSGLIGQRLGAYTIEAELGRGGMGSVWLARRTDGRFEGKAAVKFLSLAVAGPTGEARFRQEGSVLARLTHPNIGRLLDAGMTPTGQPYLMLEYVDGRQLDVWCDAQRLDIEGRIRVFLQVLAAVSHAHANLVVHRDLKPSNILVTQEGTVKLLDFGIARLLETGATAKPLTGTRDAVFTYQYAAPEQITGDPISTATDVYSLGVVLYELLAGQHPTAGAAESPADMLRAALDTDPTPLSRVVTPRATLSRDEARKLAESRDASPEKLERTFAGDLDNILAKALRKEPSQRYVTVDAFADDLQRYLNHEPVNARPTTWGYRAGKFVRRHRGSVSTAVLTVILLVAAAIMTTLQAREARLQRDNAMLQYRRSVARSTVQSDVAGEIRAVDGRMLTATERIDRASRVLQATYRSEPWLVAEMMLDLAGIASTAGDVATSLRLMHESAVIAEKAGAWPQAAMGRCYRAFGWLDQPNVDSAQVDLDAGLSALDKAADPIDIEVNAMCELAQANMFMHREQPDSAVKHAQRAVLITDPHPKRQGVAAGTRFAMLNGLAQALRVAGRVREASDVLRRYLTEKDTTSGTLSDAETENAFSNVYLILHQLGDYVTTDSIWSALARRQAEEAGAPIMANTLRFQRGLLWLRRGQLDSADTWLSKALEDTTADKGGILWWINPNMADLRLAQHRWREAIPYIEQMPRVSAQSDVIRAWLKARLTYEQGDPATALRMLEDSLAPLMANPGARTPLPFALTTAGEWRLARGDLHAADSLAQLALQAATYDSLSPTTSAHAGRAELLIARIRRAEQNLPAAREAADRAVAALTRGMGAGVPRTLQAVAFRDSLGR